MCTEKCSNYVLEGRVEDTGGCPNCEFNFFCGQFMVRCDHYMTSVWTWDLWFGYVFVPMLFLSRSVARKEKRNNY